MNEPDAGRLLALVSQEAGYDAPKGLCQCGCGEPTRLARQTIPWKGWVKGEPLRYVAGHNTRTRKAESHWNWKGGKRKSSGYILVHRPGHPRADALGYVREHILVAEAALGHPLPPGAVVHHANGKRDDNRPENLVVCQDDALHALIHQRMRAKAACGNPNWVPCRICHQHDDPNHLRFRPGGKNGYHLTCAALYQREGDLRRGRTRKRGSVQ